MGRCERCFRRIGTHPCLCLRETEGEIAEGKKARALEIRAAREARDRRRGRRKKGADTYTVPDFLAI